MSERRLRAVKEADDPIGIDDFGSLASGHWIEAKRGHLRTLGCVADLADRLHWGG